MEDKKKGIILFITSILFIMLIAILIILAVGTRKGAQVNPEQQIQNTTPTPTSINKITPTPTPTATVNNQTQGQIENDLDYGFLKLENNGKNEVYSPLSIKYALKMLEEGANGTTKSEIEKLTRNLNLTKYSSIGKVMSLANCIYVRDTYKEWLKEDYKNILINKYNAEINFDEFRDAKNVNKWIEEKTLGIIKNMLKDDLIQDPNTKMLIINALAIEMDWVEEFEETSTVGKSFTFANGNELKVKMMYRQSSSNNTSYYKDENTSAISMSLQKYENTQLEFIAIMPKNNNLKDYVSKFNQSELDRITKNLKPAAQAVNGLRIGIPKFSFEYDLKLKDDLKALGMNETFEMSADFSNITSNPMGLYVSDALHKAHIDFKENGITAAAVTVFAMRDNAMIIEEPKIPEEIIFDKPFLFIIRDKDTGELWFVGTVYEPDAWNRNNIY